MFFYLLHFVSVRFCRCSSLFLYLSIPVLLFVIPVFTSPCTSSPVFTSPCIASLVFTSLLPSLFLSVHVYLHPCPSQSMSITSILVSPSRYFHMFLSHSVSVPDSFFPRIIPRAFQALVVLLISTHSTHIFLSFALFNILVSPYGLHIPLHFTCSHCHCSSHSLPLPPSISFAPITTVHLALRFILCILFPISFISCVKII